MEQDFMTIRTKWMRKLVSKLVMRALKSKGIKVEELLLDRFVIETNEENITLMSSVSVKMKRSELEELLK